MIPKEINHKLVEPSSSSIDTLSSPLYLYRDAQSSPGSDETTPNHAERPVFVFQFPPLAATITSEYHLPGGLHRTGISPQYTMSPIPLDDQVKAERREDDLGLHSLTEKNHTSMYNRWNYLDTLPPVLSPLPLTPKLALSTAVCKESSTALGTSPPSSPGRFVPVRPWETAASQDKRRKPSYIVQSRPSKLYLPR